MVAPGYDATDQDDGSDDDGCLNDVLDRDVAVEYEIAGSCDGTADNGAASCAKDDGRPIAVAVRKEMSELVMDYSFSLCCV